jgi:spore maturation protein CgeB
MKTFFVPGDHYLNFTDVDGAVKQVLWALDNYNEAQDMANAAYRKVQPHTWDARIAQILERVGLRANN